MVVSWAKCSDDKFSLKVKMFRMTVGQAHLQGEPRLHTGLALL